MVTETKISLQLLQKRNHYSVYLWIIISMYIFYVVSLQKVKSETYLQFYSQPTENQTIPIPQWMIDDAALYNETVDPIEINHQNILAYWTFGNGFYQGYKLIVLIPVTLHILYLLLGHWYAVFKAKFQFSRTNDKSIAAAALLKIKHTTDLVCEVDKTVLCQIYHFYYNGKYYQRIEFENEPYLINEQNELVKQYQASEAVIPEVYSINDGLTKQQFYENQQKFGYNRITLKFPVYLNILMDEIFSPYFAFEVFCSALYALDNFATYSLFSLLMLFFVQGANVHQKFNSLKQTCKLAPKPIKILIKRDDTEQYISSADLVPGDLVIYKRDDQLLFAQQQQLQQDEEIKQQEQQSNSPMAMILNNPVFKLIFKMKENFFGKYQDMSIYKHVMKQEFSDIFPADMILVKGQLIADESILTGEQTSQIKESCDKLIESELENVNKIFAGTKLIQLQNDECHFIVNRISSSTEQGKLINTIAFNEERMNITMKDSLIFLFIMFVVAVISAGYTFYRGFNHKICKLNTLVLESLMVFVAVIPPDLPTELSMCINNAIMEMRKKKIFSTEPYRILNAGRCKYICFDKSGTLTQTNIKILGVDSQLTNSAFDTIIQGTKKAQQILKLNNIQKMVLGTCQSITYVDKKLFGDILEVNAFNAIEAEMNNDMQSVRIDNAEFQISKRFYFNSNLKRMSVVCRQGSSCYVTTKGSPEAIRALLTSVPNNYDKVVQEYTRRGLRILTLAYRQLSNSSEIQRSDVEKQLIFVGFLVCQTPLKKDTKDAVELLIKSDHQLRVISGDHVLNVAVCAQQCGIIDAKENILLIDSIEDNVVKYSDINNLDKQEGISLFEFLNIKNAAFALTNSNNALQLVLDKQKETGATLYQTLLEKCRVFARTTPQQKAVILQSYQQLPELDSNGKPLDSNGLNARTSRCMFVGDGANDICVIQASDLGVALLEEQADSDVKQKVVKIPYPSLMQQPGNKPAGIMQITQEAMERSQRRGTDLRQEQMILLREQQIYKAYLAQEKQREKIQKNDMLAMWSEALEQEDETGALQLGDAAMAAQFTVKSGSLAGVLDIVRQGRCALATVQMNFKTTALSCLVGAYSMTAMTLNGVRKSDYQMIASSLLSTQIMMNISKAKQEQKLSDKKPPRTIVGKYLIFSMFLQSLIHILCLYLVQRLGGYEQQTVGFGTKFSPNRVNTCVVFMQMFLDTCVTLVNYPGEPHMQSIMKHKKLLRAILIYAGGMLALLFQLIPELNQFLGFVELDDTTRFQLISIGIADFGLSWIVEKGSAKLFG